MQADAGMYDDMVMATSIWLYVLEERGLVATPEPIVEQPVQTFNVSHIFEEAEEVRRGEARESRRYARRLTRSGRNM